MLFSDFLQIIAVLIEVVITVIAVLLATRQQKPYGWGIAAAFGLFVLFDLFRIFVLPVPEVCPGSQPPRCLWIHALCDLADVQGTLKNTEFQRNKQFFLFWRNPLFMVMINPLAPALPPLGAGAHGDASS